MRDKTRTSYGKNPKNRTRKISKKGNENLERQIQEAVGEEQWRMSIREAINKGGDKIVNVADHIGKYLGHDMDEKERLTRTQIRNIFSAAKRAEMEKTDWEKEEEKEKFWGKFILFKPKIAFMTKKSGSKEGSKIFGEILIYAVDAAYQGNDQPHFRNFMDLFEAILAYHVYHGGK